MADIERPLSLLPTIKCSTCGVGIDILQLADHVCATSAPAIPEPLSPRSPGLDRAATFGGASFKSENASQLRTGRMPPPSRIDPSAANKPFLVEKPYQPQLSLTPMSNYSDSKSLSPLSASNGRSPFVMNRSATSPAFGQRASPSPDRSANMDSAFPPFPSRPKPNDKPEPIYKHRYAAADPAYAPLSPRTDGGESVLKRMNTIAPGPFDGRSSDRRPSTSHGRTTPAQEEFGHKRTGTQQSASSLGRKSVASTRSRTSTFSNGSIGLPSHPKLSAATFSPPPPPPPPKNEEPTEGIDAFLNRLQKETRASPQRAQDRSKTYPLRQESREGAARKVSDNDGPTRRPMDIDSRSNTYPTRSSSRAGSRSEVRNEEPLPLPPLPSYAKDLPSMPLHTPSDSGLSDDSVSSSGFRSLASSRSSPPTSVAGHSRKPSKEAKGNFFDEEPVPRVASPESFMDPRTPPQPEYRKAPSGIPAPATKPFMDPPESPMDPAIQLGMFFDKRPGEAPKSNRGPAAEQPRSPPRQMPNRAPETDRSRSPPDLLSRRAPLVDLSSTPPTQTPTALPRDSPKRRRAPVSKGNCRGCGEAIIGKSVKDSSGRLTGRYHKECFVCRTCRSPFPGADFYVFDNYPRCEQHYHELNGSMCRSCNRGIEGQYLETDQRQKFHPRCLTCLTCRVVLRDDYYEVSGRVYCERHAYHASQQNNNLGPRGPGGAGRNLQKRRTRLMMMM
ncbi:hypothetical protein P154DRAFT_361441 [Amniculicola lignicola CBS 123094]|uniref:LIM zinc-binding domain-containing protein n=1 Tax=Amniculicola lignicola CBS 123094 TaxID=1392246 RepID=A0A6A5VZN1_9PLEO|nr:hypothetical protein P154DRAFT_361441 [Amniculicola lignicola CBS 123094]